MAHRNPITVLLQSKNEEAFIERCVRSVTWADQVLLLDSGSTDNTVKIARSLGVDVVETADYPGWAAQFNRAAELSQHDWVLVMDCDEIVTSQLTQLIEEVADGPMDPGDGYSVNRRGDFLGVLLPNSSNRSNTRGLVRLYNRTRTRFADNWRVHEQVKVPGAIHYLEGDILHWRGYAMHEYFRVFNDYAKKEAQALHEKGKYCTSWTILTRPVLRFFWLYLRKGEFRLGTRGLIHAGLKACAEFMRYSQLWEMQHLPNPVLHPPMIDKNLPCESK